jgi:hypothetical protein
MSKEINCVNKDKTVFGKCPEVCNYLKCSLWVPYNDALIFSEDLLETDSGV